jgi:hypothetical protein
MHLHTPLAALSHGLSSVPKSHEFGCGTFGKRGLEYFRK